MKDLLIGLKGQTELIVNYSHTAESVEPATPPVISTPTVLGMLEAACLEAIKGCYNEGEVSVGIEADFKHLAATPVGLRVVATAELTEIKGRILTFEVEAHDEFETIAKGIHKRAIINRQGFIDNVNKKTAK